jgi:hypothetical protein
MQKLILISACLVFTSAAVAAQPLQKDTIRTLFENDKLKVTQYVSTPGKDVCGAGKHGHDAHLNIALTDISVRLTTADGKTKDLEIPAGSTFWSEADTHVAINRGNKPAMLYIIEAKNK